MTTEKMRSLLIVEDDLALQKQIKWSLDQFETVTANDRESALVQLRRHTPAVPLKLMKQPLTFRPRCSTVKWASKAKACNLVSTE